MFFWKNRYHVMDQAGDGQGGAGTGGGAPNEANKNNGGQGVDAEAIAKENAELKARLAKLEGNSQDLSDRARAERENKEKLEAESKGLESAITFNLQSEDFLKKNNDLLPESVKELFTLANKEKFDSPLQKASEIKSGLIQEFFSVQANMDILTQSQRTQLADFLKLTKDGKREKAQMVFENIFEPALELIKAVKRAEQVQRAKQGYGDDSDAAYKQKLISHSRQHYLGEKQNA
jgi:hypothetical protein